MKVLCAIDNSKFCEAVTEAVIAQANPKETEVLVLHVIEPIVTYPDGQMWGNFETFTAEQRKDAEDLIARVGKRLRDVGFKVTTTIEEGNPKAVILDSAAEWRPDLILVGSHGRTGLDRFLMGSVSEAVARHARCSVQIVRVPG